jgi:hypothetical protein
MVNYPDNNPKTLVGAKKVPLHLVPPSAKHYLALALENGATKYGPYNWRDAKISISTYKSALERHMDAYWDGEDVAPDSGIHHVAHAMACCALILDAYSIGMLVDDRPAKGASPRLQEDFFKNKEVVKDAKPAAKGELRFIDGYAADGSGRKVRICYPNWAANPVVVSGVSDDEANLRSEKGPV